MLNGGWYLGIVGKNFPGENNCFFLDFISNNEIIQLIDRFELRSSGRRGRFYMVSRRSTIPWNGSRRLTRITSLERIKKKILPLPRQRKVCSSLFHSPSKYVSTKNFIFHMFIKTKICYFGNFFFTIDRRSKIKFLFPSFNFYELENKINAPLKYKNYQQKIFYFFILTLHF